MSQDGKTVVDLDPAIYGKDWHDMALRQLFLVPKDNETTSRLPFATSWVVQFARHFGIDNPVGTKLTNIDFVAIAEGLGLRTLRVDNPAELDGALKQGFIAPHAILIEVHVE